MNIIFKYRGTLSKVEKFLLGAPYKHYAAIFDHYGMQGVNALEAATPVRTGYTSNSWSYKVEKTRRGYSLQWFNRNVVDGVPVVILIQYGHGTRNGAYVQGHDFINPALKPIFDALAEDL